MSLAEEKDLLARITHNPGIFGGKAIIRGMRFRVVDVLEYLANGMTREEIFESFSFLEDADITAALIYASHQISDKEANAV